MSELKLSMPEASEEEVLEVYNWLLDFINHYRHKQNRLTFADTFDLMGYDQADFWTVADDFNFLWAICHAWFGMDEEYESFEDIKAFEIITPDQLESIRDMGLSDLSATYFIDELEASEMKAEIIAALEKGEAYVLMRFDVYDVESKEAMFVYKAPDGELHTSVEGGYSAFINKQRVYKDFQILEIGLANNKDVVVKTVSMEPIDFTGPIIAPNPPTTDNIDTPLDELGDLVGGLFGNNEDGPSFLSIVAIIGGVALALGVVLLVIKLKGRKTVVNIPSSFVESPSAPNPQVKAKKSSHRQDKKTKPKKRE